MHVYAGTFVCVYTHERGCAFDSLMRIIRNIKKCKKLATAAAITAAQLAVMVPDARLHVSLSRLGSSQGR